MPATIAGYKERRSEAIRTTVIVVRASTPKRDAPFPGPGVLPELELSDGVPTTCPDEAKTLSPVGYWML